MKEDQICKHFCFIFDILLKNEAIEYNNNKYKFVIDKYSLFYTHVPNGGLRNITTAKNFKAIGVKAGTPDYLVTWQDNNLVNQFGWLEFKSKSGTMQPNQKIFKEKCLAYNQNWELVRSVDSALDTLVKWDILEKVAPSSSG